MDLPCCLDFADAPPLFRQIPEDVPSNSWSFGVYFVIFELDLIYFKICYFITCKKMYELA